MSAPNPSGPCAPWTTPREVQGCCLGLNPTISLTPYITFATNVLWRLSGRKFLGECEKTLHPPCNSAHLGYQLYNTQWDWNAPGFGHSFGNGVPVPYLDGFVNIGVGQGCGGVCQAQKIDLPGVVNDIVQVVIGGVVLDPAAYRVRNYRELVRVDGGRWPCTNDLTLNSDVGGDAGTWQITYTYGSPIPPDARTAASIFACQLALAGCGAEGCVLPARLKQLSREGEIFTMADPLTFLDKGQVGIYEVDLWLYSVNPGKLRRRPRVRSAEGSSRRPTRWT